MGSERAGREQERLKLEKDKNDRLLKLSDDLSSAQGEKQRQAIQDQIKITKELYPQQVAIMEQGFVDIDAAQANWMNGITAGWDNYQAKVADVASQTGAIMADSLDTITTGFGNSFSAMALDGKSLGDVLGSTFEGLVRGVLDGLGQMAAQWVVNQGIETAIHAYKMSQIAAETTAEVVGAGTVATAKVAADGVITASSLTSTATTTGAQVAAAGTTLSAWLPAALVASIGSFGAAAVVGGTALLAAFALIKGFSTGGYVSGSGTGTSDSIPARLSDGEFVVNAKATKSNRALLEAINSGERVSTSSSGALNVGVTQSQAPVVQLFEDASRAGTAQTSREGDRDFIKIWVANIFSDGEADQAMRAKYGLQGQGS